jgi:NTE family protein
MLLGRPGFFKPSFPSPWFNHRGSETATSIYDTWPLRETLLRLVDFELLNRGGGRWERRERQLRIL